MTQDSESFPHIHRIVDRRFPHEIVQLLPGDYFASQEPMVVYTVLGSCISACVRDPVLKIGGMNHFMLPEAKNKEHDSWGESTRYGSYAMEILINEILKRGGRKERLEVKIFGGAKIHQTMSHVGLRNADWVIDYLKTESLNLIKQDTGDIYPRKIYYFTETGRVLMKKIKRIKSDTIVEREKEYKLSLSRKKKATEDVVLF